MAKIYNLVRVITATPGTGDITPGSAVSGFLDFSVIPDGTIVPYGIRDGANSEAGVGLYSSGTLTRNVLASTNSNAAIDLSGSAELYVTAIAEQTPDCVGLIEEWPTSEVKGPRLIADGASYSRSYPYDDLCAYLVKSATVTISIASPGVVTWTAHGRKVNDPIKLFTTGALPTGLTAGTHGLVTVGTVYYVKTVLTENTFTLSATPGGAAVNTSGSQSGTHTAVCAPHGDGNGVDTFTVPNYMGLFRRGLNNTSSGDDANRSIGSKQDDAMQGHQHTYLQSANGGLTSSATGGGYAAWYQYSGALNTSSPVSDGTNGTPRTAAETRPRNSAVLVTIRYR